MLEAYCICWGAEEMAQMVDMNGAFPAVSAWCCDAQTIEEMKYIRPLFLFNQLKNQESTSTVEWRRRPVAEHCEVSGAEAEAVARGRARMLGPTFQRQRRSLSALRLTASAAGPCWWRRMLPQFKA
jgi:hypothetical protein